jgi:hypothetical protein
MHEESAKTWLPSKGVTLLLKGDSPHLCPQPSRTKSSPTRSKVLPLRHGGWVPRTMQAGPGQKEPKPSRAVRATAQRLQAFLHYCLDQRVKGRTSMQAACNRTKGAHPFDFDASSTEAQAHTSCNRRAGYYVRETTPHPRQYRASSTAESVPRLEATLRMTRQCQPSTSVTGRSSAGEGATVDTAINGPAVMVVAGKRKQQSRRQQAHAPSWDNERTLSHGVKTMHPCSVPRTARARTTAAPRTTCPVALTLR